MSFRRFTPGFRGSALILVLACAAALAYSISAQRAKPKSPPKPPLIAAAQTTPAPTHAIPQLGDPVPDALLKRASAAHPCDTGEGRHEPCATLTIRRDRITVAWDAATKRITYLYSTTLATDDDIQVGDLLPIESDSPITPFPSASIAHRFIFSEISSSSFSVTRWFATASVRGFVQKSRY